jgi:hypothetical protein
MMGMETNALIMHDRGLLSMLNVRGPTELQNEVDRSVFYSTYHIEVGDEMIQGPNISLHDFRYQTASSHKDFQRLTIQNGHNLSLLTHIQLVKALMPRYKLPCEYSRSYLNL